MRVAGLIRGALVAFSVTQWVVVVRTGCFTGLVRLECECGCLFTVQPVRIVEDCV